jgi:hypothetical protein
MHPDILIRTMIVRHQILDLDFSLLTDTAVLWPDNNGCLSPASPFSVFDILSGLQVVAEL